MLSANPIVGLPPAPLPLITVISLLVPLIDLAIATAPSFATNPVPDNSLTFFPNAVNVTLLC